MFPQKIPVKDMNPHLMCTLCGGYFIDATTIIECLHSFCKSCIVKHLASSKYCPICDVQVHKARPLENVRSDHILQEIVYKVVPGLYQNEMRCRREFYRKHQQEVPVSSEAKGEISEECSIFFPEESITLSLEYNSESSKSCQSSCGKRYLQCPAAITIVHLQKLIRSKFGLTPDCKVDFFCTNVLLPEFLTLLDVAYIFQWRRKTPLHLSYHILKSKSQVVKPIEEVTDISAHSEKIVNSTEVEEAIIPKTIPIAPEKTEEKWQEVQLQISENGVLSAAAPSSSASQESVVEESVNSTNAETKVEGSKMEVAETDQKSVQNLDKVEVVVKENNLEPTSKSELKKESMEVAPVVKDVKDASQISSTKNAVSLEVPNSKDVKKVESLESKVVKTESSVSPSVVNTATKAQSDVSKSNDVKTKLKEVVQSKGEPDKTKVKSNVEITDSKAKSSVEITESKVKSNVEITMKPKPIWNPPKIPDNTKKVCKVEPSLIGLPSGLSITQRPAIKTYPGLKPINSSKEDDMKGIAGLSKEVSIKPIVSVSTSTAALPNKTDVSCLSKISSSTTPIVPPSISKKPTPIRYKTLKSPTKPWNPSIPRSSMLMMKQSNADKDGDQSRSNFQPAKFFKTRNVPRYLGNPASGVKPMYQTSEASSANSETAPSKNLDLNSPRSSGITLMKIDPKTLSPIVVSSAFSSPSPNPNFTTSAHQKKSPLPPPYVTGSPKPSPIPKSKPVVSNKTLAHSTSIPSPAHSNSLLSSNPFFNAANPLIYPGFPHPFSHPESANRILANATNSSNLIRAMSSLCSPTAAFHPSLPPSLSLLFNAHQVGFPRMSASTNKSALKTPPSKQLSPPVSSPSSHSPISSKPKKPVTVPFLETSRYGIPCTNGILPSPSEGPNIVSSNAESAFKSKSSLKPSVEKNKVEKMDVDPLKKEAKSINKNCDRNLSVSSNKRLKRDDSVELNFNFKQDTTAVSRKPTDGTNVNPLAAKDSSCDVKSKPTSVSQQEKISEKTSKPISNKSREEVNSSSKQDKTSSESSNGNNNEKTCISTKPVAEKDSSANRKDESVIESNRCEKKGKFDDANISKSSPEVPSKQVSEVPKPNVSLSSVNNNNETSASATKNIPNLVRADAVPQVN